MKSSDRLAIAVDLGTTTIAASLLDLSTGARLAAAGSLNPQRIYGADVVSRLASACASPDSLSEMARLVNAELERLAGELLVSAGAAPESVATVAIAGNPAMEHLLLGLPVTSLAFPPLPTPLHGEPAHQYRRARLADGGRRLHLPAAGRLRRRRPGRLPVRSGCYRSPVI